LPPTGLLHRIGPTFTQIGSYSLEILARTAHRLDWFSEWTGRAISWLTLGMVIVTFTVVVLRYLFNVGWIGMQESITYMHALVFMLGAAYTLRHDGHVRVDIFYQKFSPRGRAWVDLLGTLFLLLPVTLFIAWISWEYVASSWSLLEGSRETGGLPGVYLLKTAIPMMALLLVLQGTSLALRSVLVLLGHEEDAPAHDPSTEV
jgi:TRAP-type mannitol/chloroaromatic compound transport system permease small subunit